MDAKTLEKFGEQVVKLYEKVKKSGLTASIPRIIRYGAKGNCIVCGDVRKPDSLLCECCYYNSYEEDL